MSLTTRLAIICMEAVQGEDMRLHLEARLTNTGRRIVNISQDQVESLAGNCYEVMGEDNKLKLVISTRFVWVQYKSMINVINTYLLEPGTVYPLIRKEIWRPRLRLFAAMLTPLKGLVEEESDA